MTLTVDQARQQFADAVSCNLSAEFLSLANARQRTAAVDVVASVNVPPTDNSAMDGFAVAVSSLKATPCTLPISQIISAGSIPQPLKKGTAARIFTGAEIPQGADAVVIQENCDFELTDCQQNSSEVAIKVPVKVADNIRPVGQDLQVGDVLVRQGQVLNAIDIGLLASVGETQVSVYQPLTVALISTGDELIEPGEVLRSGQIYNSNRYMLAALCEQYGFNVIDRGIVEDTLEGTKTALAEAAQTADVIISTGGVSVGDEDYIRPALHELGDLEYWRVQMKPGKPVARGRVGDTPFIGLPGNPVSSYVVFQILALPMLERLQGQEPSSLRTFSVISEFTKKRVMREEFIRVTLSGSGNRQCAVPFDNQSSGVLSSLSGADGLVRQRIDQTIQVGDSLEFLPLSQGVL